MEAAPPPPLHHLLDWQFDRDHLLTLLADGADPNARYGPHQETALHVAARRRRLDCIAPLLEAGADIDAVTRGGKTAFVHAQRRAFWEVARALAEAGADTRLNDADRLAVALVRNDLVTGADMIRLNHRLVPGFNPEEARLLPDLAGAGRLEGVALLLNAGADIGWRGLDGGTALHQAGWFGQPTVADLLIARGAPVNISGDDHNSTPLGWTAHGSRYSGGADQRQEIYVSIARQLLEAGASLAHPLHPEKDPHGKWLLRDATPAVAEVLREYGAK